MNKTIHQSLVLISLLVLSLFAPSDADAGAVKVWAAGDTLSVYDLNGNFAHIHNTMVGGHGPRLVNADVSATAAIALSKLEGGGGLVPKSMVQVGATPATACAASPCTWTTLSGIAPTNVIRFGAGGYRVTIPARPNANYIVLANISAAAASIVCSASAFTTTTFDIVCLNGAGVAGDAAFQLVLFDNDV